MSYVSNSIRIACGQGRLAAQLTAFMLAAAALAACEGQSADAVRAKAADYQKKGDLNASAIVLKSALEASPQDGEMRLMLARVYIEQGDSVSAEKEARLALARKQSSKVVLPVLARALNLQGQFQKTLDETESGVGTREPELMCLRGDAYVGLRRADDARQVYQAVLESAPNYALALIGLGRLAFISKDAGEAKRYAALALAAPDHRIDALMFQADLLRSDNKTAEALAVYDQVLVLNPVHRTANVEKAYIDIGVADYKAADAELKKARKIAPGSLLVAYSQALLDFSRGRNVEAQDAIRTVLRVSPDHMPSLLLAGAAALNLGSYHQAEHHLRRYLEKYPDNLYARKMLAQSMIKRGDSPGALGVLEPALKTEQKDVQLLALAGESYMQAANYDQAGQFFERASLLDPKAANLRMSLAMSKLGKGNASQAIDDLQMATQLDSTSPNAGIALIRTQLNLQHYEQALAAAVQLEQHQANNATVHDLKGQAYVGLKQTEKAQAAFNAALQAQPDYFQAAANLAQIDLQNKQPEAAKAKVERFLAANPASVDAMTALATMSAAAGQQKDTTAWLTKAAAVDPAAVAPAVNLISQYLQQGMNQKALDLALQLKVSNPDDPDLLDLMGKAQLATGDFDAATDSYRRLAVALPRSAHAQMQLGAILMVTKKDGPAEDAFKTALAMQPDFPAAQVALVQLYVRKGWNDLALQIAEKMQRQHPQGAAGYQLAADVLMADKKPEQALPLFEKALLMVNKNEAVIKLAAALRASGRRDEGARRVAAWLQQHPDDLRVEMFRAECALNDKQFAAAAAQFESILTRFPQHVVALNNLAMSYHLSGDKRAIATAEKAYAASGDQPAVMDTLGNILVEEGQLARGLPILLRASQLDPAARDIRLHVAQGLVKSGDKAAARKELQRIASSDMRFAQADEVRELLKQLR